MLGRYGSQPVFPAPGRKAEVGQAGIAGLDVALSSGLDWEILSQGMRWQWSRKATSGILRPPQRVHTCAYTCPTHMQTCIHTCTPSNKIIRERTQVRTVVLSRSIVFDFPESEGFLICNNPITHKHSACCHWSWESFTDFFLTLAVIFYESSKIEIKNQIFASRVKSLSKCIQFMNHIIKEQRKRKITF